MSDKSTKDTKNNAPELSEQELDAVAGGSYSRKPVFKVPVPVICGYGEDGIDPCGKLPPLW